jgi:hypothetical protein
MANLKLIGSKLLKIEAERNPDFSGKLELKTNIKINSIEKIEKTKDAIKVSYNFEVIYTDLGKISIEGILFLSADPKEIQKILEHYKKKTYGAPEYMLITNLVIQKASIRAFELEEELGLPIHIKLPSLSVEN